MDMSFFVFISFSSSFYLTNNYARNFKLLRTNTEPAKTYTNIYIYAHVSEKNSLKH